MRVTNLIVGRECGVLTVNVFGRLSYRIPLRADVNLIVQTTGYHFGFKFGQVLDKQLNNRRIETRVSISVQQIDSFISGHALTKRSVLTR